MIQSPPGIPTPEPETSRPMLRITLFACLIEVLGMAGFAAFATLLPQFMEEWNLSNTEAGWITGNYYIGYVAAVVVLTSLTDRLSPRDVYVFSMGLSVIACVGFGWFAEGFWTATLFQTMGGVGLAGTYMPGLKMLSDFLHGPKQSRYIAFYTSSFGIGASFSIVATGWLVDLTDWQTAYVLLGVSPAIALLLTFLVVPRRKTPQGERPSTHVLDFRPVLRCRPAMAYVMAYTAHNFELFAYRAWTVAFLVFAVNHHPEQTLFSSVAVVAAIINLFGVPASVLGNEMAVRIGRHRWITWVMLSSAVFACVIGFSSAWSLLSLTILCSLYSITVTADSAALTAGAVAAAPAGYRGATMAVYSSIAFFGAFLGPLCVGVVLDLTGGGLTSQSWGYAFVIVGLVVATGPLFLRWLGR